MEKKSKKRIELSIVFLVLAVTALLITSIYYKNKMEKLNEKYEAVLNEKKDELIEEYNNKEQFIGINGCFLGIVDSNNKWYSSNEFEEINSQYGFKPKVKINVNKKDFVADDIIENEYFNIYLNNKYIGKKNDVFYDKELNPEYYFHINMFRFNDYKHYEKELGVMTNNWEKESKEILSYEVSKVLNSNNVVEVVEETEFSQYEKYLNQVLDDKNINSGLFINKILIADANNDSNNEIYILANTPEEFVSDSKNDLYSFVIKVENDNVKVILESIVYNKDKEETDSTDKSFNIFALDLVDLNNDGLKEIVIYAITWDHPEIFVIRLNENKEEELCLYGDFTW